MQIPPWKWRHSSPILPPSPITFALLKPPVASDRCRSLNLQHRRTPSSEAAQFINKKRGWKSFSAAQGSCCCCVGAPQRHLQWPKHMI